MAARSSDRPVAHAGSARDGVHRRRSDHRGVDFALDRPFPIIRASAFAQASKNRAALVGMTDCERKGARAGSAYATKSRAEARPYEYENKDGTSVQNLPPIVRAHARGL